MQRLLVVDDTAEHIELLMLLFSGHGYAVDTAMNGVEALQKARQNSPDAVISDILMPQMDGFSLCREWKKDPALQNIPFLFYTATYTDSGDEKLARDLGADRFLLKPLEPGVLLTEVRDALARRQRAQGTADGVVAVPPAIEEPVYLLEYNQALVRKLEKKMLQLERVNRELAEEVEHRRQTEKELARLSTAIEHAAESILITDPQGVIQYVNPAFVKITGYGRDEALGQKPSLLTSGRQNASFYRNLWQTILAGRVWVGHFINRSKDGSLFEEDASISPVVDAAGTITNFVAVKRDVTNERRLERQVVQSQKMEAIGTLAGGIAHDFNNILTAILGYASLVYEALPEEGPLRPRQAEVIRAGHRARDLVAQILTFSRQSQTDRSPVFLQSVVKEVLKLLRASLPATIEIRQTISADCDKVLADPTQMHQILMNLCTNAYHAMRGEQGGVLSVSLQPVELGDNEIAGQQYDLVAGKYVQLVVEDSGCGMDQATVERIFEPYFTTKPQGEGTGLGLSMVHGIVVAHGGSISVSSALGVGTTFTLCLPAVLPGSEVAPVEPCVTLGKIPHGTEKILVVDDEEIIGRMIFELLSVLGYQVRVETSGVAALDIITADPNGIDLLLTDMTMPVMTGAELARKALELRPDLPVILCSGYSELINEVMAKRLGIREYIMKPVAPDVLGRLVRKVLDSPG